MYNVRIRIASGILLFLIIIVFISQYIYWMQDRLTGDVVSLITYLIFYVYTCMARIYLDRLDQKLQCSRSLYGVASSRIHQFVPFDIKR